MNSPAGSKNLGDGHGTGFDLVGGHVVLRPDGVLLDTLAPTSFSRTGQLSLFGEDHLVPVSADGKTIDDLVEELRSLPGAPQDLHLDAVLGLDLLLGRSVEIHWVGQSIMLWSRSPIPEGFTPRGGPLGDAPVVEVGIAGRTVPVAIDSGRRQSYLEPTLLGGLPRAVHAHAPNLPGEVASFLYRAPLEIWDRTVEVEFGALPAGFDAAAVGAQGILGTDALARWGDLRLDFPDPGGRRRRGRKYPYVGIRFMACAYGTRRVHFLASGPARSDSFTIRIVDPEAHEKNSMTEAARAQLIAEVKQSVATKGFRQSCRFGPHEAMFIEHDGSVCWASSPAREPAPPGPAASLHAERVPPEGPAASNLVLLVGGGSSDEDPVARLEEELEALRALDVQRFITFATAAEVEDLRLRSAFDRIGRHAVDVNWLPWRDLVAPGPGVPVASEAFRWLVHLAPQLREGKRVAIDLRGGRWAEIFAACSLVAVLRSTTDAVALVRAAKPGALAEAQDEVFVERFARDAGPRLPHRRGDG